MQTKNRLHVTGLHIIVSIGRVVFAITVYGCLIYFETGSLVCSLQVACMYI